MKGQKQGWLIIGVDLLIVLGIYYLYSSFAFQPQPNTITIEDQLRYEATVSPPTSDTIPVTLVVRNTASSPRTATLPEGLTLFLTTGRKTEKRNNFWAVRPLQAGKVTLDVGERRTWSLAPNIPTDVNRTLYLALFIDKQRQGKVAVPQ